MSHFQPRAAGKWDILSLAAEPDNLQPTPKVECRQSLEVRHLAAPSCQNYGAELSRGGGGTDNPIAPAAQDVTDD